MSFDNFFMERLFDFDSGYYLDFYFLEFDENLDVFKVIFLLLRCFKIVFVVE